MTIDGGLAAIFRARFPSVHWQPIETGGTGRGIPDLNFCSGGVEGWIENKVTSTLSVGLRPEQIAWLARRSRAGGRAFVAVRRKTEAGPRRGPATDSLWLFAGDKAAAVALAGLREDLALGVWSGGPAKWRWTEVARIIFGRP